MPIYEYACESCARITEHMQKMSDPPLAVCPACGGPVHRLVSRSSFQLKGSGWYRDLYSSSKPSSGGSSGSSGSSGTGT